MVRGPTDPWHTCIYKYLFPVLGLILWSKSDLLSLKGRRRDAPSLKRHISGYDEKDVDECQLMHGGWWVHHVSTHDLPEAPCTPSMVFYFGSFDLDTENGSRYGNGVFRDLFLTNLQYGPCNSTNESLVPALWARRPAWRMRGLWRVASSQDVFSDCSGDLRTQTSEGHCHFFVKGTPSHDLFSPPTRPTGISTTFWNITKERTVPQWRKVSLKHKYDLIQPAVPKWPIFFTSRVEVKNNPWRFLAGIPTRSLQRTCYPCRNLQNHKTCLFLS